MAGDQHLRDADDLEAEVLHKRSAVSEPRWRRGGDELGVDRIELIEVTHVAQDAVHLQQCTEVGPVLFQGLGEVRNRRSQGVPGQCAQTGIPSR